MVSRVTVTGVFLVLTAATAVSAVESWQDAISEATLRSWGVAGYSLLKVGIVLAFSIFVALRDPARRPSRDPVAFAACGAAVAALVALREPPVDAATTVVVAGDLVALASFAWLLIAVLALGRCFGVLPEARGLVTHGPYRLVRHPVYLGELGACAGLVLAAPRAWNFGAAVVFALAQAVRMRLEENALSAEFPEYVDYAARTPRLIPRMPARRIRVLAGGRTP